MDLLPDIARQGFGYVLFVATIPVLIYQTKKINEVQDKRIQDGKEYRDAYVGTARDILNSQQNIQKALDSLSYLVQKR